MTPCGLSRVGTGGQGVEREAGDWVGGQGTGTGNKGTQDTTGLLCRCGTSTNNWAQLSCKKTGPTL
jgi:hypothetical protein